MVIAELPAVGTLTVRNQAEAIELERTVRRHVFAWLDGVDPFDWPNLGHPRLRRLEQAVRDAEWAQDWPAVEAGWQQWLDALRGA